MCLKHLEEKNKMSKTGIIIGVIVVIVLLVIGFYILQGQANKSPKTPTEIVKTPTQPPYPSDKNIPTNNQNNPTPSTSPVAEPSTTTGDPALNALTLDSQSSEQDDSTAIPQEDTIPTPSG